LRRGQLRRLGVGPCLLGGRRHNRADPRAFISCGRRRAQGTQEARQIASEDLRATGRGIFREGWMAVAKQTMTDEQRKSVVIDYLKAFDRAGKTWDGGSILDLFADDAQVYFPKWGVAYGKQEIGQMFGDIGSTLKSILHHYSHFNFIFSGSDLVVCEGTSEGEHRDGPWRAGAPEHAAGRWCDVFEIRDWKIQRCFIYLDPDYAGKDTARYPWLKNKQRHNGAHRSRLTEDDRC